MTSARLTTAIETSTSMRATPVGEFDPHHRGRTKPLFVAHDLSSLSRLRHALRVSDGAFADQVALMTPGDLDLNFLRGHELLATVSYIYPTWVRWTGWRYDARLINPDSLSAWLIDHGWEPPAQSG